MTGSEKEPAGEESGVLLACAERNRPHVSRGSNIMETVLFGPESKRKESLKQS